MLTYPLYRDLHWLLTTPPLYQQGDFINNGFLTEFAQPLLPQLQQLDCAPIPPFSTVNRRLGSYYEQLWLTLIDWHPDYQVLAHDLVIVHQKRTLGALDIVVKHLPSDQIEHWELAVKFYLNDGDGYDPALWLGPGRKDSLGTKLERMLTKQLPLSQTTQAKQLFQQRGWRIDKRRLIVQGRLYQAENSNVLPPNSYPDMAVGRWYHLNSLPNKPWRRLRKQDWLAGRDWRVLPRWRSPQQLDWPQHLFDPTNGEYAFVVPDGSEWGQCQ